jgi:hypothetical protein
MKSGIPPSVAPPGGEILYPLNSTLIRRAKAVAAWPWILAAVSTVNVVLSFYRAPIRSPFGFCTTELIFEIGRHFGPIFTYVSVVIVFGILSAVAVCGFFTMRFRSWAYIASIAFISFDTVILMALYLLAGFWGALLVSVILRMLAVYSMYIGSKAAKLYSERKLNGQA